MLYVGVYQGQLKKQSLSWPQKYKTEQYSTFSGFTFVRLLIWIGPLSLQITLHLHIKMLIYKKHVGVMHKNKGKERSCLWFSFFEFQRLKCYFERILFWILFLEIDHYYELISFPWYLMMMLKNFPWIIFSSYIFLDMFVSKRPLNTKKLPTF